MNRSYYSCITDCRLVLQYYSITLQYYRIYYGITVVQYYCSINSHTFQQCRGQEGEKREGKVKPINSTRTSRTCNSFRTHHTYDGRLLLVTAVIQQLLNSCNLLRSNTARSVSPATSTAEQPRRHPIHPSIHPSMYPRIHLSTHLSAACVKNGKKRTEYSQ